MGFLTARDFAKQTSGQSDFEGVIWQIDMPKGTHALNPNNYLEKEWVLPHGTRLEIMSVVERVEIDADKLGASPTLSKHA